MPDDLPAFSRKGAHAAGLGVVNKEYQHTQRRMAAGTSLLPEGRSRPTNRYRRRRGKVGAVIHFIEAWIFAFGGHLNGHNKLDTSAYDRNGLHTARPIWMGHEESPRDPVMDRSAALTDAGKEP